MKNKKSLIIIILGILFFPLINGAIYYFTTKDLVVVENPTYKKKDDEFQLYSMVRSLTEYEIDKLPIQQGYDAEEFQTNILNSKDNKAAVKIYIPKAMVDNKIITEIAKGGDKELKADQTIRNYNLKNSMIYCKKKKDALDEVQKSIYEKYNNVAYCQVYVNKNIYYAKVTEDNYSFISRKEFEGNAYDFNESIDFIKLVKKSIRLPHESIFFLLVLIMTSFQFFKEVGENNLYIFMLGVYVGCLVLDAFFYNYILGVAVMVLSTAFVIYEHKNQYKFGKERFILGATWIIYMVYYFYYRIITEGVWY